MDAFGAPPDIMAFDLSALAKAYADHDEPAREALTSCCSPTNTPTCWRNRSWTASAGQKLGPRRGRPYGYAAASALQ